MSILNEEQLSKLKKELPELWAITISQKLNCSKSFVRKVFKNEAKDVDMIDKVINEALKLKKLQDSKIDKINQKIASI